MDATAAAARRGPPLWRDWLYLGRFVRSLPTAWFVLRRVRRSFSPDAPNEIVVPEGPHGMPGARVFATTASTHEPGRVHSNGSRSYFMAFLSENMSTVDACVVGRATEAENARTASRTASERFRCEGHRVSVEQQHMLGHEAYWLRVEADGWVTETWLLDHDGWLTIVKISALPPDDPERIVALGRQVLATWEWTSAPSGAEAA